MSVAYVPRQMREHLHHRYDEGVHVFYVRSPQDGADRWANAAGTAQQAFQQGVQNTQVDVVQRAIQSQPALLQNFTESVTSGRWARGLTESGGTANWKAKTIAKAGNYGTGISAAKGDYLAAAQQLYPYIAAGQQQIASMPSGTLAASLQRQAFWTNYMYAYGR